MFSRHVLIKIALVITVVIGACSVLKKEDPEKGIRAFISSFESSLVQSDKAILNQFDAQQTHETILSVVRILQNKEHEFIECTAAFPQARINISDAGIQVVIPVDFRSKDVNEGYEEQTTLTAWLEPKGKSYTITKFEGEAFYKAFATIRNNMEWLVEQKREIQKREAIYAKAKVLQQQFDSVIWFVSYQSKNYFYVVNGSWNYHKRKEQESGAYKMGLVDETGTVIIPVEYELVGTLGFDTSDMVEVHKDGKVGYFNIATKQLTVEPLYDMIIPYLKDSVFGIVKHDTVYGWLNKEYNYHEGFPSEEAKEWVNHFAFLPANLQIINGRQTFCEIANEDNAGYGIIMPPSYLVKTGIFKDIIGGISTTPVPISGWTEYVETKGNMMQTVTDKVSALLTTITERYLEGREEFYSESRLVFVNSQNDTLAVTSILSDGEVSITRIDSTILQVKSQRPDWNDYGGFYESGLPIYQYFELREDLSIVPVKTSRTFPHTAFVKLDSSYLSGEFTRWDSETESGEKTTFLSLFTISHMRNEILASYGYRFPDPETYEYFNKSRRRSYTPRYDSIEEFEDQLTEIDRHNLAFLQKIIDLMQSKPV